MKALIEVGNRTVAMRGKIIRDIPVPIWKVWLYEDNILPPSPTLETDNPQLVLNVLGQAGIFPIRVNA